MSSPNISQKLRRWLLSLGERCEYCQTSELITGIPLEADHIHPESKGGSTKRKNLCRACSPCNTNKNDQIEAVDPDTEVAVRLFHPREHEWDCALSVVRWWHDHHWTKSNRSRHHRCVKAQ